MDLNSINIILEMELPKLWDIMKLRCEDQKVLKLIKFGSKIKFDIEDYIDEDYTYANITLRKNKKIVGNEDVIRIGGQEYKKKEFFDELKERRLAMIKWFELNLDLSTAGESRENNENGE